VSDTGFQHIDVPLPSGLRAMPVPRPEPVPPRRATRRDGTESDPYAGLSDMAGRADPDPGTFSGDLLHPAGIVPV